MKKCSKCGVDNPDESKFCCECGSPLQTTFNIDNIERDTQQYGNNPVNENPQFGSNLDLDIPEPDNQQIPPNPNNQQYPPNPNMGNQQQNNPNVNNFPNNDQTLGGKISNLSTAQKVIGLIAICCIGILILSAFGGNTSDEGSLPTNATSYGSSNSSSNYTNDNLNSTISSFSKEDCEDISYKELNKNPDKYYGDSLKLSGKVMQISEGGSYANYLLMYVNGEYDQLVYVEYSNDTNIVEDDWITVYGIGGGDYSYSTKIGGTNTVPYIYGEILEKSS